MLDCVSEYIMWNVKLANQNNFNELNAVPCSAEPFSSADSVGDKRLPPATIAAAAMKKLF